MKHILLVFLFINAVTALPQENLKVKTGDDAIDFKLESIDGEMLELSEVGKNRNVVLIVLRGYPGYQCPICSRQVGQFVSEAKSFDEKDASVFLIYPGPSNQLEKYAGEFSQNFNFPENFYFALDPDYVMINKYGLRWDAPKETAYPSTFVINKKGKVIYSKVSTTHGGRASSDEVLKVLDE